MKHAFHETRTQTIFRHTRGNITAASWLDIAQRIVDVYHTRVAPNDRDIAFHTEGNASKCHALNAQKLHRYMDDSINARMPVDLEEAWVLALAEPFRSACLTDLAARYGLLAAPIPEASIIAQHADLAVFFKEAGEAGQAVAHMLADGKLCPSDRPMAARARRELLDVVASAVVLIQRIDTEVGEDEPKIRAVK